MKTISVVHCWSAPRSRSTALMYSFEARGDDCVALDEPLYREWLIAKGDSVERPYKEALISGVAPEGDEVHAEKWKEQVDSLGDRIKKAAAKLSDGGVIFCKHMAKHLEQYDFDKEYACSIGETTLVHKHLLLVRNPVSVVLAWGAISDVHGSNPTSEEVGYLPLMTIYSKVSSKNGVLAVLDSDELVTGTEICLANICEDLSIPYSNSMLTWKSGEHPSDGPWAKWWYHTVWKTDGWARGTSENPVTLRTMDPKLMTALKAAFPAFEFLIRLTHRYKQRGPPPEEIYEDPRNEHLLAWVGTPSRGRLYPRELAAVSPWDSSVQGGDGAWEGLRVYRGKILSLDKHLRRLIRSAKALGYYDSAEMHTVDQIKSAIFQTLAANGMRDSAHMRLTLTRGEKCTSSMNPKFNVYGTNLIILAEWKPTEGATTYDNTKGITLITASQRRSSPSVLDSKIHHNCMINNILPKIQANLANAADAIMLDVEGYVSETNATNIFMVDDQDTLLTPHGDHCLPGITRQTVIQLAAELNIACEVRRVSLSEFHSASEVFTTGTMGELSPVVMIDGRVIGEGKRGPITSRLQEAYKTLPERPGWATEIPPFE